MKPSKSRTSTGGPNLPLLVLVSGAPATGKTTLARRLAADLRLPLVMKDGIKEILGDALGAADVEQSRALGTATYMLLQATAGWLLDAGVGAILESNFGRGLSEPGLAPLVARSAGVLIHCETTAAVVLDRYASRTQRGVRHAVHFDTEALPRVRSGLADGLFEPLDLPVPVLRVDTASGYNPPFPAILAFIRLAATRPRQ